MLLYIDTSIYNEMRFVLIPETKLKKPIAEFSQQVSFNESYKTLEFLEKFLKSQKVTLRDIKKIVVCSGPGSFTGIRVGVSMAQAFGMALTIPVSALSKDKIPENLEKLWTMKVPKKLVLAYGQEPNITIAKSKKSRS